MHFEQKKKKKKTRPHLSFTGSPGSLVNLTDQPGFAGFLLTPAFCLSQTGPTIRSTRSWINSPYQSEFNNNNFNLKKPTLTKPVQFEQDMGLVQTIFLRKSIT
jgi:hypothetical protein